MSLGQRTTNPNHQYDEGAQKLWSIFVDAAEQHDAVVTGTWKVGLDSTLIFSGLFSATVTAFIVESYKLLKPDPNTATIALLTQMLAVEREKAFHGNTTIPLPPSAPSDFKVPVWAIAVNVLWFLSLTFILTAAATVTLVQKWVSDYVHRVHRFPQPLKRSRMWLFLTAGIDKCKLDDLVGNIPVLLHISLSLFFIGLCIFLAKISRQVVGFVVVVPICWLVFYCIATIAPLRNSASPLETPFSNIIQYISSFVGHRSQEQLLSLSALREMEAMSPSNPDEVDARAISWIVQRSTDDREREDLLSCIPSFLKSDDGRETWKKLLEDTEIIEVFIRGIAGLLDVASSLSGNQVNPHEVTRVTICFDALFALLRATPHSLPSTPVSSLSKPLYRLAHASYQDQIAFQTRAICVHALHQHLSETQRMPDLEGLWKRGLQADKQLQEIDLKCRELRCDIEKFNQANDIASGNYDTISKSLAGYLAVIHSSSETLTEWLQDKWGMKDAKDVLGDWADYLMELGTIIEEYSDPYTHGLLSLSYTNIPYIRGGTWNILALLIMAYMRHTEVYSPLPPLPGDQLDSQKSFWFHFYHSDVLDTRWIPKAFDQELDVLASALDILVPQRENVQVGGSFKTNTDNDIMMLLRFSHSHPRPRLPTMGRPFSLWASIVYATASGCETRGLSDLVCALKGANFRGNDIQTITGPIIGETLRILKEGFTFKKSTGSLLLSRSVLQNVLSWEREGGLFPFSEANIEYLVNKVFLDILKKLNGVILLRDGSPDSVNIIENLEESSERMDSTHLHDHQAFNVASVQGPSQAVQEPSRGLNNIKFKKVVLDSEKKQICSCIMEGRKRTINPHAPRGDSNYH